MNTPVNTETTLLPCPFCGQPPIAFGSGDKQSGLMIECVSNVPCCHPHVSYYDHATAIAVWNTRAVPSPVLSEQKREAHRQAREDFARGNFFQNDSDLLTAFAKNFDETDVARRIGAGDLNQ